MKKGFEQEFQKFQTDMIQICLENVENRADAIYIYCYYNEGRVFCNHFYKIHGKPVKKHLLNTCLMAGEPAFDVSISRQRQVNQILVEDLAGMKKVCEEYEHEMPKEVKIICTISRKNGKPRYGVKADYSYEVSLKPNMMPSDLSEEWFKEVAI